MGTTVMAASVSLDGYIANDDDSVGELFDWFGAGDQELAPGDPERPFRLGGSSADWIRQSFSELGALVIGRRLFDYTNGWGGRPAAGDHVFVVTHETPTDWPFPDAPFTFVTDGVAAAVARARAFAGERTVSIAAGDVGGQALAAGLVDEIEIGLVPTVFGSGKRFFGDFVGPHVLLEDPHVAIEGRRVTHLRYRVRA